MAQSFPSLEIKEFLAYLADLVDTLPDPLLIKDENHRLLVVNRAYCDFIGLERERLIGRSAPEYYPVPGEAAGFIERDREVLETGREVVAEERITDLRGKVHITLTKKSLYLAPDGKKYLVALLRDITEQVETKHKLRERLLLLALEADLGAVLAGEQGLREMLQASAEAIVRHLEAAFARIWLLEEQGQFLRLEASAGLYTHLDGEHGRIALGKYKIGRIAAERSPHLTNQVIGDPQVHDQRWARRTGMVAFAGYPLTLGSKLIGVLAMFARHELSGDSFEALGSAAQVIALGVARKLNEENLRQSEERFRAIFEEAGIGLALLNLEGRITAVNEALCSMLDYTDGQLTAMGFREVTHPGDLATDETFFNQLVAGDRNRYQIEKRYLRKDGNTIWGRLTVSLVRDRAGRPAFVIGMVEDITGRKQAEKKLIASRAFLEKIIDSVADPVFVKDSGHRFLLVNEAFCRFIGHSRKSLIGRTDYDFFPREEVDVFLAKDQEVLDSGQENINEEKITDAEGVTHDIITKKTRYLDYQGEPHVVGVFRDVTRQKKAEAALRESEERFRAVAETASEGIVLVGQQGRVRYWNPAAERIFGHTEKEMLGEPIDRCIPLGHLQKHHKGLVQATVAGKVGRAGRTMELTGRRKDGEEFPLELSLNHWQSGEKIYFSAIVRDVTDRKRAEAELRESEERFRQLAEHIRDVFWITDPDHTRQIYISPAYEEVWGRSRRSWYEDPSSWLEAIHPDDRPRIRRVSSSKEASGEFDEEFRVVRPDGEIRWIHDRAFPVKDDSGRVYRIVGIAEDITERKALEEKLQEKLLLDELTGLYNRRGFVTLAEQEMKKADRKGEQAALCFIDLDDMKAINDKLGHQVGDHALQETAAILSRTFRESDVIARIGGDEFAVWAAETPSAKKTALKERLADQVETFNRKGENPFRLSLSMGVVGYEPRSGETLENLMNRADKRMYREKQRKKSRDGAVR